MNLNIIGNFISAQLELILIDILVAKTKGCGITKGRKANLLTHLQSYKKFCDRYRVPYFPADVVQMCRFGQYLALTFESPHSVDNYQSGIRTCHTILGLKPPPSNDKDAQWFRQGLLRTMDHEVR